MNINDLYGIDRDLVIVYCRLSGGRGGTAATTCHPAPPSEDVFGLNEVSEALRLMGASPIR